MSTDQQLLSELLDSIEDLTCQAIFIVATLEDNVKPSLNSGMLDNYRPLAITLNEYYGLPIEAAFEIAMNCHVPHSVGQTLRNIAVAEMNSKQSQEQSEHLVNLAVEAAYGILRTNRNEQCPSTKTPSQ